MCLFYNIPVTARSQRSSVPEPLYFDVLERKYPTRISAQGLCIIPMNMHYGMDAAESWAKRPHPPEIHPHSSSDLRALDKHQLS
jgi:hypothetical protein